MRAVPMFALALLSAASAHAADDSLGKALFARHCAECHAPNFGHPGTQQLGWTRGAKLAVLEERKDLRADYVSLIVRKGFAEMPAFRPTEINDVELAQLALYLTKPTKNR